jgi:hypothetical protein
MSPESPLYPALIQSIIDNMNLSNREQLIQTLQEAGQVSPEAQQAQQAAQQAQMEFQQSQTNALNGQGAESQARAAKIAAETKAIPVELEIDQIKAVTSNLSVGDADDKEFERRLKIADAQLKEKKLNLDTVKAMPQ